MTEKNVRISTVLYTKHQHSELRPLCLVMKASFSVLLCVVYQHSQPWGRVRVASKTNSLSIVLSLSPLILTIIHISKNYLNASKHALSVYGNVHYVVMQICCSDMDGGSPNTQWECRQMWLHHRCNLKLQVTYLSQHLFT